ncbi:MAG: type II toxin-antitoxin system PemK/MazF family toxin [Sphingomonadales bacterium]|nr:type II toxin-antitoxin system PemK/MazF family toxin [Sphingomonadales bacterium]
MTTSWTPPQPTDVLSYDYLWAAEAARGAEDSYKTRPVVVVLATIRHADHIEVLVAPITTRQPSTEQSSVEIPQTVRNHLKLDASRSWVVTSEVNRFRWPGPDVRPIQNAERATPYYGKIPAKLLQSIRDRLAETIDRGSLKMTDRTS